MSTSSSDLSRIVLTGASGWVGKAILHQLQAYLTPAQFLERVIPFSSSQKKNFERLYSSNFDFHSDLHSIM